jgi:hypothetical protein
LPKLDPQLRDDSPREEATLLDFDGGAATFSWPALPASSYRIEVAARGVGKPLATIAGVRLADDAAADPRLDPIDVRGSGRTLTVRVRSGTDGPRPLTDGGVVWCATGQPGQGWNGLLLDAGGEARLLVGPDAVDLTVAVPGFRLWEARAVVESTIEATLEPCLQIPFSIAPAVAARFAGYRIRIGVEPRSPAGTESEIVRFWRAGERDPAVETSRSWLQRLAGSGECTLDVVPNCHGTIPVSGAGTFQLSMTLLGPNQWIPVNDSWLNWQRSPLVPAEVVVHDESDAPFVIDVDEAVSAKVLEALRQRR